MLHKDGISQTAFAKHVNVSKSYINRLIKEGKLKFKLDEKNKISLSQALSEWNAFKGLKVNNKGEVVKPRSNNKNTAVIDFTESSSDEDVAAEIKLSLSEIKKNPAQVLNQTKAKEQIYKAEQAKINYLNSKNELIPLDLAKSTFEHIATTVKNELQSIPQRISGKLEGRNMREIESILEVAIADALENLKYDA